MTKVFVTHLVEDYDRWRTAYDADRERREESGLNEGGHFHSDENRNKFIIIWNSTQPAAETNALVSTMLSDPGLLKLMEQGGVLETPSFWVAEE